MKLEPPFQAKTLQLLSLKIVKGRFDDPGSSYSREIKSLLSSLLQVDPKRRPKITDILNHPLIKPRVGRYLSGEEHRSEFSHTVLHNQRINVSQDKLKSKFKNLKVVTNENVARKQAETAPVVKPETPRAPPSEPVFKYEIPKPSTPSSRNQDKGFGNHHAPPPMPNYNNVKSRVNSGMRDHPPQAPQSKAQKPAPHVPSKRQLASYDVPVTKPQAEHPRGSHGRESRRNEPQSKYNSQYSSRDQYEDGKQIYGKKIQEIKKSKQADGGFLIQERRKSIDGGNKGAQDRKQKEKEQYERIKKKIKQEEMEVKRKKSQEIERKVKVEEKIQVRDEQREQMKLDIARRRKQQQKARDQVQPSFEVYEGAPKRKPNAHKPGSRRGSVNGSRVDISHQEVKSSYHSERNSSYYFEDKRAPKNIKQPQKHDSQPNLHLGYLGNARKKSSASPSELKTPEIEPIPRPELRPKSRSKSRRGSDRGSVISGLTQDNGNDRNLFDYTITTHGQPAEAGPKIGKTAYFIEEGQGTGSFFGLKDEIDVINRASQAIDQRFSEIPESHKPSSKPKATGLDFITIKQKGEALRVEEDDPTYYVSGYGQLENLRNQIEKKIGTRFGELYGKVKDVLEDPLNEEQIDVLCDDPKSVLRILKESLNSQELVKAVAMITKLIIKEQTLEESEKHNIFSQFC